MPSMTSEQEAAFFNLQQAVAEYYDRDDYTAEVSFAYLFSEKRWWVGVSRHEYSDDERTIVVQKKHKDWSKALKALVRAWLRVSRTPPPQTIRAQLQAFLKAE